MGKLKLFLLLLSTALGLAGASFQIGLGRSDVTGPSVEVPFVKDFLRLKLFELFLKFLCYRWATHQWSNVAKASTPVNFQELSFYKTAVDGG